MIPGSIRYRSPPMRNAARSTTGSGSVWTRMPGSIACMCAAIRRFEPGPPTQNSVRSPKPCWAASCVTTCAFAPQSLMSADSSSSANTSWRCTARSVLPASRLTTSSDSELAGSPKKACLRRSLRFHR